MSQEIKQKLLNISYTHIIRQGKPSFNVINGSIVCSYRTADGLSCAAAPFILEYDPEMESNGWAVLTEFYPELLMPEAVAEKAFISNLQYCHDNAVHSTRAHVPENFNNFFMELYKKKISELARNYDLTLPVIEL